MKKIFVTGALGQIGSELVIELRKTYGLQNVIATDIARKENNIVLNEGIFEELDVMNTEQYSKLISTYKPDTLIHLASLLSATAEAKPSFAWNLNMGGLMNSLEIARNNNLKFFSPSSIAVFGKTTPKKDTPQDTINRPETMYGVTKVAGELLCDYYFLKYGVDTRGVRFPGLISSAVMPGGGTTDYAVEIYYEAIKNKQYDCYIAAGTFMDMMYMPDAIKAIINLMEADGSKLIHRNAFNVSSMSFDPEMIAASIKKVIPDFKMSYRVDSLRQKIAESWPDSLNCDAAKKEWGFSYKYDLDTMTSDMINKLKIKLNK